MFVGRRSDGSIYGTWTCRQPDDADHPNIEEMDDSHPDVVVFLRRIVTMLGKTVEERLVALELQTRI